MARSDDVSPRPALLGLLMSEPKHGYELYQEFEQELGRVWRIGQSQLYAQLKQLAQAELVTAEMEVQDNRPPRKVYHLTPAGREVFLGWLHQPTPYLRHIRVEFLARLYFFRRLALPGLHQLVDEQKAACHVRVESLERAARDSDDDFRRLVLEFRQGQLAAVIRWLDRCSEVA